MGAKKSVFASKAERANYGKLSRQWGEGYHIYHNLPFLHVFDTDNLTDFSNILDLKPIHLTDIQLQRLKKTSIDYTFCDRDDCPILCIEFDGLQDGFNVGNRYYSEIPANPWRRRIMDLKLQVAHGSLFPFVVVGSVHFDEMSPQIKITIVDGIIGDVLAHRDMHSVIAKGFSPDAVGMSQADFDNLTDSQQQKKIQGWIFEIEAEADFKHNPIYQEIAKLGKELGFFGGRAEWIHYPNPDRAKTSEERRKMIDAAILEGTKFTITHPTVGEVSRTVMLPQFKTFGVSTLTLSQEMARLVALDTLRQKLHEA